MADLSAFYAGRFVIACFCDSYCVVFEQVCMGLVDVSHVQSFALFPGCFPVVWSLDLHAEFHVLAGDAGPSVFLKTFLTFGLTSFCCLTVSVGAVPVIGAAVAAPSFTFDFASAFFSAAVFLSVLESGKARISTMSDLSEYCG
eukprot:SAG31_NODE_11900_length_987_cov_2.529279_1_plen_142_part_10